MRQKGILPEHLDSSLAQFRLKHDRKWVQKHPLDISNSADITHLGIKTPVFLLDSSAQNSLNIQRICVLDWTKSAPRETASVMSEYPEHFIILLRKESRGPTTSIVKSLVLCPPWATSAIKLINEIANLSLQFGRSINYVKSEQKVPSRWPYLTYFAQIWPTMWFAEKLP